MISLLALARRERVRERQRNGTASDSVANVCGFLAVNEQIQTLLNGRTQAWGREGGVMMMMGVLEVELACANNSVPKTKDAGKRRRRYCGGGGETMRRLRRSVMSRSFIF